MQEQTIFDFLYDKYKITNRVRLIELFAGIGSQAKALKNIGVDFETYKVVEFDKYAIASYNAIHDTDFPTLDITQIDGKDLEIVDTDKYTYLLTYSFPCQDLSLAGKRKGMKDTSTRSGLLWEVERILNEIEELPQVLLMENVPQVHSKDNIQDFQKWILALEKLGYKSYWKDLNAKDFGIPQNRNRTFMISILGDYNYTFPKKQKLKLRLKDMLEDDVDEKYYLSDKMINYITAENEKWTGNNENSVINRKIATTINTGEGHRRCDATEGISSTLLARTQGDNNLILIEESNKKITNVIQYGSYYTWKDNQGNYNTQCNRACKEDGISLTIPTIDGLTKVLLNDLRIRKLTPKECFRLMGFSDEDFEKASKVNSNAQLYKQAGNSICVPVLEAIFRELF